MDTRIVKYEFNVFLPENEKPDTVCSSHLRMENTLFIKKCISRDSDAFDEPLLKAYTDEHPV